MHKFRLGYSVLRQRPGSCCVFWCFFFDKAKILGRGLLSRLKLCIIAAAVILVDWVTKHLVETKMTLHETIKLPLDIFQITYIRNPGAAFGILPDQRIFFIVAALVAIVGVLYFFDSVVELGKFSFWAAALILGGAVGNLIDRIQVGTVTDFIDFKWFPVFNVADIALTIGVALFLFDQLQFLRSNRVGDTETLAVGGVGITSGSGELNTEVGGEMGGTVCQKIVETEADGAGMLEERAQSSSSDNEAEVVEGGAYPIDGSAELDSPVAKGSEGGNTGTAEQAGQKRAELPTEARLE